MLIASPGLQTLPVGLASLIDENRTEDGMIMAATVFSLVPSLAFFGWIERSLTTGLLAGAVKGGRARGPVAPVSLGAGAPAFEGDVARQGSPRISDQPARARESH